MNTHLTVGLYLKLFMKVKHSIKYLADGAAGILRVARGV